MSKVRVPYNASYRRDQHIVNHLLLKDYVVTFVMSYGDGATLLRLKYRGYDTWDLYECKENDRFVRICEYTIYDFDKDETRYIRYSLVPIKIKTANNWSKQWSYDIARTLCDHLKQNITFGSVTDVYIITSLRRNVLRCK